MTLACAHGDARYIWLTAAFEQSIADRNAYACFRRTFKLNGVPDGATLSLFADSRYRLLVNGRVLGHGPARFFAASPRYDTWDVTPHLRPGDNVVAVLVNSIATQSFHAELHRGGLIAWLTAPSESRPLLVTDRNWRCRRSPIHEPHAPRLTFALNPGEYADTRRDDERWVRPGYDDSEWPAAAELGADVTDGWGPLSERPINMLDETEHSPAAEAGRWACSPFRDERVHSVCLATRQTRSFMNYYEAGLWWDVQSPRDQRVEIAASPGRLWVNGREAPGRPHPDCPHHRVRYTVSLRRGRNRCFAWRRMGCEVWDYALGLPDEAGLRIDTAGNTSTGGRVTIAGPFHVSELDEDARPSAAIEPGEAIASESRLVEAAFTAGHVCASTSRAWCRPTALPAGADAAGLASVAYLFDMGEEYLGRVAIDFEAETGDELQFAFSERLNADGSIHLHGRPMVDLVERIVCRGGRQRWLGFHPRGGRYLEVRVIGRPERFAIHELKIRGAQYRLWGAAAFRCSDQRLNRIWQIGRRALVAGMEDAYCDSPWRERGTYIGDNLVQFEIDAMLQSDHRICRRSIELFLEAQDAETGLVPPCPHGLNAGRHIDYSAILFQCLRRYVEVSGDASLARDERRRWRKLAEGLMAVARVEGLYDGADLEPYIDIAMHRNREPVSFAVNAFMQKGFVDAAWAMRLAGDDAGATKYANEADRLASRMREAYWDGDRGVYLDLRRSAEAVQEPSIHSNALALLYDIALPDQVARIERWLLAAAADNFLGRPGPPERDALRCNAYFSYFLLAALAKRGRISQALDYIRTCWGHMLDQGAWNTWESFGGDPGGSLSHAWSAAPTWFLSSVVMGVEAERLHDAGTVRGADLTPRLGGLDWAEAVLPRPGERALRLRCERTPEGDRVVAIGEVARSELDPR